MRKRLTFGLLVVALAAAAATTLALVFTNGGRADINGPVTPESTYSVAQAQSFTEYPLYFAGSSFGDLPLTAVERDNSNPDGNQVDDVTFMYGTCTPTSEEGCAVPVQIQIWPACLRNPTSYPSSGPMALQSTQTTMRGVPANFYEDGARLEVQTGTATVVIFATESSQALAVANALRGVNNAVTTTDPLPQPAAGAMDGTLTCSS